MYAFSDRQKKIIRYLMQMPAFVKGKVLADALHISLRTLQYEITAINQIFHDKLILSTNQGYMINADTDADLHALFFLPDQKNEQHALLKQLLLAQDEISIDDFAERCYLSTSTLLSHLKQLHAPLAAYQLHVKRKHNHIWIDGSEYDKRKLINHLLREEAKPGQPSFEKLTSDFGDMNLLRCKQMIEASIERYHCHLETSYAGALFLNIAVALFRIHNQHYMEALADPIDRSSIEYQIARDICEQYAQHYPIHIYPEDVAYIALLLIGQIKPYILFSEEGASSMISAAFKEQVRAILHRTFQYYMLHIDYASFLSNFTLHVDALIKRAKYHQYVSNATTETIKFSCPFIYDVAVYLAKELEEAFAITIPEEEIGFLSIHIGFGIESSTKEHNCIRVLLICEDYHQSAQTIIKYLKKDYADVIEISNVIFGVPANNDELDVDLILSTIPLHILHKRVLLISPFYTDMDRSMIEEAISACLKERKIEQEHDLLTRYFDEHLFFHRTDLTEKEEVIRFLGQQIVSFGIAQPEFIDSVLKREEMSSTCFFETFAIPHAMELNAKKTMFCVLINENGIHWDQHQIKIVLMIAVKQQDRLEFMKIYNSIIHVLWNQSKVAKLIQAQDYQDFIKCLKADMR